MPRLAQRLKVAALWNGMTATMSADLSRLFYVAAPFTLLLSVAIALFGPPAPSDMAMITGNQLLWRLAVPGLFSAFAQLLISNFLLRTADRPRAAFGAALVMFPVYLGTQLLFALPISLVASLLGALPPGAVAALLLMPGLYLFSRLMLVAAAVTMIGRASPAAILRRCWAISQDQALPLSLFAVVGVFSVIGISILAEGIGGGLEAAAGFAGLPVVGKFSHAAAIGAGSCFITVGSAAAGTAAYRLLTAKT